MLEPIECAICGMVFMPKNDRQFVCSAECGLIYSRNWIAGVETTQRCKRCGRKFSSWGHKIYCSSECRDAVKVKHDESMRVRTRLDEILTYCKEQGITYAEYQMQSTNVKLNKKELQEKE